MNQRGSGGSGHAFGILILVLGLVLAVGGAIIPNVPAASRFLLSGAGLVLFLVGIAVAIYSRLYVKASADWAFVKTGRGKAQVIMDGGSIVVPLIHNITWVRVNTMTFPVDRRGKDAFRTMGGIKADIVAEFFIRVPKREADVLNAATVFGGKLQDEQAVLKTVEKKLESGIRDVAAKHSLEDLNADRPKFIKSIKEMLHDSLASNGLELEDVTISYLDQTPLAELLTAAEGNILDADAALTISQKVQGRRVERNKIVVEADQTVKRQDVEKDQAIFDLDVTRAKAEAQRDMNVRSARATNDREAAEIEAQQSQKAEVARVEKDKGVQLAQVKQAQEVQVAEQGREQAAETATRDKLIAIAAKDRERAEAESSRLVAERNREAASQAVLTVQVTAEAERNKAKVVIDKQADAERTKIERQVEADVAAYTAVKAAEGEQGAAEKKAAARLTLAEAEKDARTLEAQGEQAVQIVPVNVERERVNVEGARVDVQRRELANKAEFERVAVELQRDLAVIAAERDARIEAAKAIGSALAASNITMWSDPNALNKMVQAWTSGQQNGQFLAGLATTMPPAMQAAGLASGMTIAQILKAAVKKLTGMDVDERLVEHAVKEATAAGAKSGDGAAVAAAAS